jgi:hypothetical protein
MDDWTAIFSVTKIWDNQCTNQTNLLDQWNRYEQTQVERSGIKRSNKVK